MLGYGVSAMTLSMDKDTVFSLLLAQSQARETEAGGYCVFEMAASVSSGSGGESLKASCLQDRLSPGSQCTFALFLVATALFPGCFLPVKTAARD